ncbi:MAG TPA: AMP-binding protein [Thermoanaerobaculia bacterium]|nr:AMP-binding protein [Thermoanaerobaculia bacterium]
MNLLDLFEIRRRERPAAPALRAEDGAGWTYGELLAAAEALAAGLAERGLGPGDRVAFLSGNRPELVAAHLAVLRLGAVAVPVNTAYRAREVAHVLADCEPRLVVTEAESAGALDKVAPADRRSVAEVLVLDDLALSPAPTAATRSQLPAPDGSDPALLVYTSGTTGRSKGAVLTHDNLLATVTGLLAAWAWRPDDVLLLALPLFHVHGLVVGLHTALAAGATVELRRRFDAAAVADELARGGPTVFFGVPTMYVRLVEELRRRRTAPAPMFCHPERSEGSGWGRMRLFASGSAPLAPETFHAFRDLTGHEILERYGMSEAGMLLSNPYAGPRRPGTVGVPLPGVSIRIVDPEGRDLPPGAAGELLVAGGNVFGAYWRDPEKTAESFVADAQGRRWFRTGDLARRDPDTGSVTLLGRGRELIIRGGLNVYPREIEEVLAAAPGVREAAVAGRPDPEWGEVPVAWVVRGGSGPGELEELGTSAAPAPEARAEAEAALLAHCRDHLASFKVPAEIRFVPELPRNALGKIQKHRLPR